MDVVVKAKSFFFCLEKGILTTQCSGDWKLAGRYLRQPRKRCPIASRKVCEQPLYFSFYEALQCLWSTAKKILGHYNAEGHLS